MKEKRYNKQAVIDMLTKITCNLNRKIDLLENPNFHPHLVSFHQRETPKPIFIGNLTYSNRFTGIEWSFPLLKRFEQNQILKETIHHHFHKHEGDIPGFGKITHYVLYMRDDFDEMDDVKVYDINGDEIISPPRELKRKYGENLGLWADDVRIDQFINLQ
ncbi:MAG: hypothetical protein Q7J05_04805 [Paludibacter sp.]|nr:hypothetical protein [Paludibacter sp.]